MLVALGPDRMITGLLAGLEMALAENSAFRGGEITEERSGHRRLNSNA